MVPHLNHNSSTPLHVQAEEYIRELIRQEEYRKGKLLPNEVVLSKEIQGIPCVRP